MTKDLKRASTHPVHIHPQLRCLVLQEGLAKGAWNHSKRDVYIFHIPFWEWEVSNSQMSATAGKTQKSAEEKSHSGEQAGARLAAGTRRAGDLEVASRPTSRRKENIQLPPRQRLKPFGPSRHSESQELF